MIDPSFSLLALSGHYLNMHKSSSSLKSKISLSIPFHSLSRVSMPHSPAPCKSGSHIHWFHFLSLLFILHFILFAAWDTGAHSLLETLSLTPVTCLLLLDPFRDSCSLDSLLRLLLPPSIVPDWSPSMTQSPLIFWWVRKLSVAPNVSLDAFGHFHLEFPQASLGQRLPLQTWSFSCIPWT